MSSPSQSRAFSLNHRSPVRGSTAPPTLLRTPIATSSAAAVRRIDAAILRQAGGRQADVARRPEGNVEPALAVGHQVLPAMRHVGRHVVVDDLAGRRLVEAGFGIVVFVELVDVDHVERAIHEGDARRHAQPGDVGLRHLLAVGPGDGVNRALVERADEQRALVAQRHLPRLRNVARPHLDLEARRQLDVGEDLVEIRLRRRRRLARVGHLALLRLGLVAQEPVGRRIGPEVLVVGIVLLEFLSLHRQRAAADHGRDRADKAQFR